MIGVKLPRTIRSVLGPFGCVGPEVCAPGPLAPWSGSIAPVVTVCEAASGPTYDWSLDSSERVHEGVANPAGVWDLRILADPDPVINHAAKMFSKVPVNVGADRRDLLPEQHFNTRIGSMRRVRQTTSAFQQYS